MIKMTALLEMFNTLAVKNAKTYIQSGNIVFQYKGNDVSALEKKIEKKIRETFGFDVPVVVLSADELPKILKNNPYLKNKKVDLSRLYVTFFKGTCDPKGLEKLAETDMGADEFSIREKVIYLHLPNTYGKTKLDNNHLESKLKIVATTRNWKTMNELRNMATAIGE